MGKLYGYARVSTREQNEARQLLALADYGVVPGDIHMDKLSGKDFQRPAYQRLTRELLAEGDVLVVKNIDRLGRNYKEILEEWRFITKNLGADIKILDMPLLDTRPQRDLVGTLISDIVLQLLSFVAENERQNIRQRQAEGIAAAKLRGIHLGRPPVPLPAQFPVLYQRWRQGELTPHGAARLGGFSSSTFYRLAHKYEATLPPQEKGT